MNFSFVTNYYYFSCPSVEEVVEQIEAAPPPSIAITPEVVCPPCVCTTPPPLTEPAEKAKISRKPLQGGRATTTTEHAMSSSTTLNVLGTYFLSFSFPTIFFTNIYLIFELF